MAPGDKAGFVEGMKLLLNRELIQKAALRGFAEIANDQPIPPMSPYHNAELAPRAYDPEKAKALFGKAGVLGQPIPVVASDAANSSIDMAMILQQAGAKIGMKFDVQRVPSDGYWSNYWLKAPVHFGNINPRPTPDIMFSLLYASNAPWNESRFKSPKFDAMLLEARGELDFAKRKAIYDDMQAIVSTRPARRSRSFSRTSTRSPRRCGPPAEPARRPDGLCHGRVHLARGLTERPGDPGPTERETWTDRSSSLVLGRLGLALVTLLIVSFVVFAATAMLPGDIAQILLGQAATAEAVAGLRAAMHLDDPAILRFLRWLARAAPGRPRHLLCQQHAGRRADRRRGSSTPSSSAAVTAWWRCPWR